MPTTQIQSPDHIRAALESDRRSTSDKKRDAKRKPRELLAFYNIEPG